MFVSYICLFPVRFLKNLSLTQRCPSSKDKRMGGGRSIYCEMVSRQERCRLTFGERFGTILTGR